MVEGYTIKDVLGFYTKYLLDFITTKQNMWDDKENPCMFEVVEGNGCPWKLHVDLWNIAHFFVLQNVAPTDGL